MMIRIRIIRIQPEQLWKLIGQTEIYGNTKTKPKIKKNRQKTTKAKTEIRLEKRNKKLKQKRIEQNISNREIKAGKGLEN